MSKKSRWGRIAKLGELSTKVSSSYLGQRVAGMFQQTKEREESLRSTHLKNAERIVDTMSVLKGAAMKVGQSLAVMADSMDLPEEVSSILSKLNDQAQPVPYDDIKKVIQYKLALIRSLKGTNKIFFWCYIRRFNECIISIINIVKIHQFIWVKNIWFFNIKVKKWECTSSRVCGCN